jgi:protein-disulfide isomerase
LAEPVVRKLLADMAEVAYVWRHLPLNDVHPHAQLAAEAAEAAARQSAFWPMRDLLLEHQDASTLPDLLGYAAELALDPETFAEDMRTHIGAARIAENMELADLSGVSGTPTFFINGMRHHGAFDIDTLTAAVKAALARSVLSQLHACAADTPYELAAL